MKKVLIFIFGLFIMLSASRVLAEQIDINTATLSQLDELTGIRSTYAQRIIDGRPYSSVDDLLSVKGIGPATLQKIKSQGFACVNCAASAEATASQANNVQTPTPAPTPTPATTPAPIITYPSGVFINELLPNPQGADETDEWTELYNSNNFDVDLSGWQLQDAQGSVATYTIPTGTKILAEGFKLFTRPETKIMLNNDKDSLNLLTPDKKIVDSATFASAPLNQSYNKINSGWQWSLTLTPAAANIITAAQAKTLPNSKNSVKNNGIEAGLADISQAINANQDNSKITSPWFLFFMVLAITIISAAIVLFIKFKFLKNNVRT